MSVLYYGAIKSNEEIERLNLRSSVVYARRTLNEKINKALKCLKDYEVTYQELNDLIQKKIKQ